MANEFLSFILVLVTSFVLCTAGGDSSSSSSDSSLGSSSSSDSSDAILVEEHVPMTPSNKRYHVSSMPQSFTLEPQLGIQIKPFLEAFARPFAFSPIADKFAKIIDNDNANAIDFAFYSMYTLLKDQLVASIEEIKNDETDYENKILKSITSVRTKTDEFILRVNKKLNQKDESFKQTSKAINEQRDNLLKEIKTIEKMYENQTTNLNTQTKRIQNVHKEYTTTLKDKYDSANELLETKKAALARLTNDTAEKNRQTASYLADKARQLEEMTLHTNLTDDDMTSVIEDDDDLDNLSDFRIDD